MKKSAFVVLIVAFLLLVPLGTVLAKQFEPTGERLGVYDGTTCFPADTPFHVRHGWGIWPNWGDVPVAQYQMSFRLDGTQLPEDYIDRYTETYPEYDLTIIWRLYYWNFAEGMPEGENELTIEFLVPCYVAMEGGCEYTPAECPQPNAPTVCGDRNNLVTFQTEPCPEP